MTLSRRSTIKAIGVVGTGSALAGTALAVNEHQDDERNAEEAPADDEEVGAIRVGHFSPDAPNVDVYVDEQQILSDVGYDELSPYLEIVPGTYTLTITEAGGDEPVYERTIAVDTEFYTAAAIGELEGDDAEVPATGAAPQEDGSNETAGDAGFGNETAANESGFGNETAANESGAPEEGAVEDDATGPGTFGVLLLVDSQGDDAEEGTAPLRFVHAVPDAPSVDVAAGETGARIFEDVGYTEPSGYVPVEPGTRTLEIFPAGEGDLGNGGEQAANDTDGDDAGVAFDAGNESDGEDGVISRPDPVASVELELEANTAYTAFAIGYLAERDDAELTVDEEEYATDDEFGGSDAGGDGDESDRSFSVRVAVDGEMDDESDADEEEGVEDDELEPDDERAADANESTTDANESATDAPAEPADGSDRPADGGYNGSAGDERNGTAEHHADD